MGSLKNLLLSLIAGSFLLSGCRIDGGTEIPNELAGRLVTRDGRPVTGARVSAFKTDHIPGDASDRYYSVSADKEGRFSFRELPEGRYNIIANAGDLVSMWPAVSFFPGAPYLPTDTLRPPGSLSGKVEMPWPANASAATVQILGTESSARPDTSGRFLLSGLAEGPYRLRVSVDLPGYLPLFQEIFIHSGQVDTLRQPLRPIDTLIPMITGLRAQNLNPVAIGLTWDPTMYGNAKAYLVYRDSLGSDSLTLLTQVDVGSSYTLLMDTIYHSPPRKGQYPLEDSLPHSFVYRMRILDSSGRLGPLVSMEATSIPLAGPFGSWKLAKMDSGFGFRPRHSAVVFLDAIWLFPDSAGGDSNIWISRDGLSWSPGSSLPLPANDCAKPAVFQNKLWLMAQSPDSGQVGYPNALWNTVDGINWVKVTDSPGFPPRSGFSFIAYRGKLWVFLGFSGSGTRRDIYSSEDGVTWTLEKSDLPETLGPDHSVAEFRNELWLVGSSTYNITGLWRRDSLAAWSKIVERADFPGAGGFQIVVHDGKLWRLGEQANAGIWFSLDGFTWIRNNANSPLGSLLNFRAISFKGKLWAIGARPEDVLYLEGP
jgi:hypothetical protein